MRGNTSRKNLFPKLLPHLLLVAPLFFYSGGVLGQNNTAPANGPQPKIKKLDQNPAASDSALLSSFDVTGGTYSATVLRTGNVEISDTGTVNIGPTPSFDAETGQELTQQWSVSISLDSIVIDDQKTEFDDKDLKQSLNGRNVIQNWDQDLQVSYKQKGNRLKQGMTCRQRCQNADSLAVVWNPGPGYTFEVLPGTDTTSATIMSDETGRRLLTWERLKAFGAEGSRIPTKYVEKNGKLVYSLDLSSAKAPIRIDPIIHDPSSYTELSPTNQNNSFFGLRVSPAGDVDDDGFDDLLVTQSNYTAPGKSGVNHGRALLFHGSSTGVEQVANQNWAPTGGSVDASFGYGESVGDVDGDGISDLAVGGYSWKNSDGEAMGRVLLYSGSPSGPSTTPAATIKGQSPGGQFGRVLSGSDLNCDGQSDLVVSTPFASTSAGDNAGKVEVFFGQAPGGGTPPITRSSTTSTTWESDEANSFVGFKLDSRGNVNGANCSDLTVGAPFYGDGGEVFIWSSPLSAGGSLPAPSTSIPSPNSGATFGYGINTKSDFNGDGFDDVVVGALTEGSNSTGSVRIYHGSSSGVQTPSAKQIDGSMFTGTSDARFGYATTTGDFNGDGIPDLAFGAPRASSNPSASSPNQEGAAYLFLGRPNQGINESAADWSRIHDDPESQYGFSLTFPGNLDSTNNSSPGELVIGAGLHSGPLGGNTGKVFSYPGRDTCFIGGEYYGHGVDNPQNSCEYCDVNVNDTAWTQKSDGVSCDDGDACTVMDQCQAGVCEGQPKDCDDGLSCTSNSCNSDTGACEATVENGCLIDETCFSAGASNPSGTCEVCDPSESTTSFVTASAGTTCDDGFFCTVDDECTADGNCVSGGQRDCTETLPQEIVACNNDFNCSEALDQCEFSNSESNGTTCDDGSACTSGTTCQAGVCEPGMTTDCSLDPPEPCQAGYCDPETGNCETENVDTTCDGGLYQCQEGSCPDACESDSDCGEGAVCCTADRPCDPDPGDGDFECTADNLPPQADAGQDQAGITEGATVTLDGTQSSDPDGDMIDSYNWTLSSVMCASDSTTVTEMRGRLENENDDWDQQTESEQLTFTAPRPACEGLTLTFQLVVSDGETQSNPDNDQNATVEVSYGEVDNSQPFTRITGPTQADCGETITLSGSESQDPDGDELDYTWSLISGEPALEFSSMSGEEVEVTIPDSVPSDTLYEVSLTGFDGFVTSEPDVHVVAVDACSVEGDAGVVDAGGDGLPGGDPGGSGCLSSTTGGDGVPGVLLGLLVGGAVVGVGRRRRSG